MREIELCGPMHMHWMYPFERLMKILKGYTRNRNRLEGCIVEGYIAEEGVDFCLEYIGYVETISVPKAHNTSNKGIGVGNPKFMARDD